MFICASVVKFKAPLYIFRDSDTSIMQTYLYVLLLVKREYLYTSMLLTEA